MSVLEIATPLGPIEITPEKLAEMFWELDCEQQSDFFKHLLEVAGDFDLMSQMIWVYQWAEENDKKALEGFQVVGSAAYKHILWGQWQ